MSSSPHNIRHALKSVIPNWLADVPGLNVGFAVLFTVALIADLLVEFMFQGLFAAWPGKGTDTALPLIGQSRGIIRGFGESDAAYAVRLQDWLDLWPEAGSDERLGRLIQGYLAGNLVVRVVDRRGQFTTINADQTVTVEHDASWNFDATQDPQRVDWWSDLWIIVYVTDNRWPTYTTLLDPVWLAAWGNSTGSYGAGHQVPRTIPADIKSIISIFKGAHTWIEALVFTSDTALFIPGSLGSTYPNGRWGNWSRIISNSQSPARAITSPGGELRYWIPKNGG